MKNTAYAKSMQNFFRRVALFAVLAIGIHFALACSSPDQSAKLESISEEAEYFVVYSGILSKNGGCFFVDKDGNNVGKELTLAIQNLNCYEVTADRIYLSGHRANNNLFLNKGVPRPITDFYFLNNKRYTGVTAFTSMGDSVIGIMNGGRTEDTYKTDLVYQKLSGEVLQEHVIDLYVEDIIAHESNAFLFGEYYDGPADSYQNYAMIINYSLSEAAVVDQHVYKNYTVFSCSEEYQDFYLAIAGDSNYYRNTVVAIDAETYEITSEIFINDELSDLLIYNDRAYAVGETGVYELDLSNESSDRKLKFSEYSDSDSYSDFCYQLDGKWYFFVRKNEREYVDDIVKFGCMLEVDPDTFSCSTTEINYSGERNDYIANMFIIPASFMRSEHNA